MSAHDPSSPPSVMQDGWMDLRRFTTARIALGRAGSGLPTAAHLEFQLAHARARDAVHMALDVPALTADLAAGGFEALLVTSAARDRQTYLTRPDLGRQLSQDSQQVLALPRMADDVVLVIADGLSSTAVQANAVPVIAALAQYLRQAGRSVGPVIIATQGRVALGDHIGEILQAKVSVMLIGERPGLSASDSLGLYMTWMPQVGRVDAERNCISNVRAGGLSPAEAAAQCASLIENMFQHRSAGVALSSRLALLER